MNILKSFITGIILFAFVVFVIALAQTSLFMGGVIEIEESQVITGLVALCASGYAIGLPIAVMWITKWPQKMTWPIALAGLFALVFATIAYSHLVENYWAALAAISVGFVIGIKSLWSALFPSRETAS